jgi:hypothetical protein
VVVPNNDVSLVISLLKVLSREWTFSQVKIQDLNMVVRSDTMMFVQSYLPGDVVFGNHYLEYRCCQCCSLLLEV